MRDPATLLVEMHENADTTQSSDSNAQQIIDVDCVEAARRHLWERRLRSRYFPDAFFGEAAWDILLDLFIAARTERMISVSSACIAAAVPPTTALRWISALEERQFIVRYADPGDGRRVLLSLSATAEDAVRTWLLCVERRRLEAVPYLRP